MKNEKPPISAEDLIKFFEGAYNVRFMDEATGKPALETISANKAKNEKSDYDLWLEEQSDDVKREHDMGAL
ncbi:MAG: hypothetical protein P1P90_02465 [Patescibacteria group bacterium]|nr:hypothetical protein [Patescibacteria group bacterium]